jgi:hypothetical protein
VGSYDHAKLYGYQEGYHQATHGVQPEKGQLGIEEAESEVGKLVGDEPDSAEERNAFSADVDAIKNGGTDGYHMLQIGPRDQK